MEPMFQKLHIQEPLSSPSTIRRTWHRRTTEHELNRVANSSSLPIVLMLVITSRSTNGIPDNNRANGYAVRALFLKNCLLSYLSALIAGASVKAAHGAALLSGLSSTEEPGCSELLRPAVCSFRTIASVLRRLESRTSALIGYCLKLPGRTCVPGTFLTLHV